MGGNTGEIQKESERELYKYTNHQAGTTKVSTIIILVKMYKIFRLLVGVPDYGSEITEKKIYRDRVHCYSFTEGCL